MAATSPSTPTRTTSCRGDTNRDTDVFVRDVFAQTTERVSTTALGYQADNDSYFPALSPDGRYVGFSSYATNIFPFDRAGEDVFLHDRTLGATTLLTAHETGWRARPRDGHAAAAPPGALAMRAATSPSRRPATSPPATATGSRTSSCATPAAPRTRLVRAPSA